MGIWDSYRNFVIESFRTPTLDEICIKSNFHDQGSLDEISQKCKDIISKAEEEIYIIVDNCIPAFFKHKNIIVDAIKERSSVTPITILARRDGAQEQLSSLFNGYKDKITIHEISKKKIKNGSYQNDYFIIADRKNIFLGKPSFQEACFIYDAELLGSKFKSDLNSLCTLQA